MELNSRRNELAGRALGNRAGDVVAAASDYSDALNKERGLESLGASRVASFGVASAYMDNIAAGMSPDDAFEHALHDYALSAGPNAVDEDRIIQGLRKIGRTMNNWGALLAFVGGLAMLTGNPVGVVIGGTAAVLGGGLMWVGGAYYDAADQREWKKRRP